MPSSNVDLGWFDPQSYEIRFFLNRIQRIREVLGLSKKRQIFFLNICSEIFFIADS